MFSLLNKIKTLFDKQARTLNELQSHVERINSMEVAMQQLTDDELCNKTVEFRTRIQNGAPLDSILHEAFAVTREVSVRTIGLRHYDVQMIGALVLHRGQIAEMKTGEGKTLVATPAAYLNALCGHSVHIVTPNDYLAARDAEEMGRIFHALGMTVGAALTTSGQHQKKEIYTRDIVYATNSELGFDYLRDSLVDQLEDIAQRKLHFAIIDEVDNILIDEARTPLIISGRSEGSVEMYVIINEIVKKMTSEMTEKDDKSRHVTLTDAGVIFAETELKKKNLITTKQLYEVQNISIARALQRLVEAHHVYRREVDYIVEHGEVIIIDDFTGRKMPGRRYSNGLHQAIEAKENVRVREENQTIASITLQNLFKRYEKISGMTGTAYTDAKEFRDTYGLDVIVIPTNKPMIRQDYEDEIYRTDKEKCEAIMVLIKECYAKKQPVLVGTTSVEKSEELSGMLHRARIPHQVLNAKHHAREAEIIAQSGRPGMVTIATNMAGRGTDIRLGGNVDKIIEHFTRDIKNEDEKMAKIEEIRLKVQEDSEAVKKCGGLYVIIAEIGESLRIDNQFRGRAGRQGDQGQTKRFISLEDKVPKMFGGEKLNKVLIALGIEYGEKISNSLVSRTITKAQARIDALNHDIRRDTLKYDNIIDQQRKIIYNERLRLLDNSIDLYDEIKHLILEIIDIILVQASPNDIETSWKLQLIHEECTRILNIDVPIGRWRSASTINYDIMYKDIKDIVFKTYDEKRAQNDLSVITDLERKMMLSALDKHWRAHLSSLESLHHSINLRSYAQKNPFHEYQTEAAQMFSVLIAQIKEEAIQSIMKYVPESYDYDQDQDSIATIEDLLRQFEEMGLNTLMPQDDLDQSDTQTNSEVLDHNEKAQSDDADKSHNNDENNDSEKQVIINDKNRL